MKALLQRVREARVEIAGECVGRIGPGLLVLVCSVLAYFVSPLFLLLTGFFGAGLLFAGTTGVCGMAAVLTLMPWNRRLRPAGCTTAGK